MSPVAMFERAELLSRGGKPRAARRFLRRLDSRRLPSRHQKRLAALDVAVSCQLKEDTEEKLAAFQERWGRDRTTVAVSRICQACGCDWTDDKADAHEEVSPSGSSSRNPLAAADSAPGNEAVVTQAAPQAREPQRY